MKLCTYLEFINEHNSFKVTRSGALSSPQMLSSLILIKKNKVAKLQQLKKESDKSVREKLISELNSLNDKENKIKELISQKQKDTSRKMGEKNENERKKAQLLQDKFQSTLNKLSALEEELKK